MVEEVEEVVELAVDIAADGDGGEDGLDVGFFDEEGADKGAEGVHGGFGEGLACLEVGDPGGGVACHGGRRRGFGDCRGVQSSGRRNVMGQIVANSEPSCTLYVI